MINLVISGGQTGADQAGLRAAKKLGLATSGYVPLGCKTDDGPAPWLLTEYDCREHHSNQYAPRTIANVRWADATLWFGDDTSPGGRLTLKTLRDDERQWLRITALSFALRPVEAVRTWLGLVQPSVLNVAGNRERMNPGIGAFVEQVLLEAISAHNG